MFLMVQFSAGFYMYQGRPGFLSIRGIRIQGLFKSGIRYISAEIWVFGISCFLNFRSV